MTIASTVIRADYVGSGITGPYTFPFTLFTLSDLEVITTDLNGNDTVLVLNTDYTVVGIKAPTDYTQGGTLTLTVLLTTGYNLALVSNESGKQGTSIKNNTAYYAYLHENEFDRRSLFDLQMREKMGKSLVAPDSEAAGTTNLTLPRAAQRALSIQGYDAGGNSMMYPSSYAVGSIPFLLGYAFASLPAQGAVALAFTTDGVMALYNTVLNQWVKLNQVSP